jgi:CheY-like chemotaxis protein
VLVVDNNAVQLKLAQVSFACSGFRVATERDATRVIDLAYDLQPDAIVGDIAMRGLDGFELCRALRREPRLADIPVVLATSRPIEQRHYVLGACAGATAVVVRSPTLCELIAAVDRHTTARTAGRATRAPDLPRKLLRQLVDQPELGPDDLLAAILDASGFSLGMGFARHGDDLELVSQHGFSPARSLELTTFFGQLEILEHGISGGFPIGLESTQPRFKPLLARAGVGSMFVVPFGDEAARGVVVLASPDAALPRDWRELATAVTALLPRTSLGMPPSARDMPPRSRSVG